MTLKPVWTFCIKMVNNSVSGIKKTCVWRVNAQQKLSIYSCLHNIIGAPARQVKIYLPICNLEVTKHWPIEGLSVSLQGRNVFIVYILLELCCVPEPVGSSGGTGMNKAMLQLLRSVQPKEGNWLGFQCLSLTPGARKTKLEMSTEPRAMIIPVWLAAFRLHP